MTKFRAFRWTFTLTAAIFLAANLAVAALGQAAETPRVHQRSSAPSDRALVLEPVIAPPAGTEAVFLIEEKSVKGVGDRSGFFLFAPDEALQEAHEHIHLAVRARYTMLAPDPRTGDPRVLVEAVPVDVATGNPLRQDLWRSTYRLEDDEAEWVEGSRIPDQYEDLVAPDWLAEWTMTPPDQLPQQPIRPGFTWRAVPDEELDDFPFGDFELDAPLTGQFVGWVDVPDAPGPAAHITETMRGTSSDRQDYFDGIPADVLFEANLSSQFWLLPDHFPHRGSQHLHGSMLMVVREETGAPQGMEGTLEFFFSYERSIVRESSADLFGDEGQVEESWEEGVIRVGERVTGSLGPWSEDFGDGSYADFYVLYGNEGEDVRILLQSDDFDAYMFLVSDSEEILAEDDDSGGGTDARIRYTLPYTGRYWIIVNTLFAGETGAYTLSVSSADPAADIDRALELIERLRFPHALSDADLRETEAILYDLLDLTERYRQERMHNLH